MSTSAGGKSQNDFDNNDPIALLCMVASQLVEERDMKERSLTNTNAVERRISCHRCGNIRKKQMNCSKGKIIYLN